MASNHGHLRRDLIGNSLRIQDKTIVDNKGNFCALDGLIRGDLTIKGTLNAEGGGSMPPVIETYTANGPMNMDADIHVFDSGSQIIIDSAADFTGYVGKEYTFFRRGAGNAILRVPDGGFYLFDETGAWDFMVMQTQYGSGVLRVVTPTEVICVSKSPTTILTS